MDNITEILPPACCTLCSKPEDEVELIEIESNSLKYGEEIIEFSELLSDVFHVKVSQEYVV